MYNCIFSFSLQTVGCMPPPVSSAVILTKAVGGNEVSHGANFISIKMGVVLFFLHSIL